MWLSRGGNRMKIVDRVQKIQDAEKRDGRVGTWVGRDVKLKNSDIQGDLARPPASLVIR